MKISVSECTFSDSSLNSPAQSFKSKQFELFETGQMFGTGQTTVRSIDEFRVKCRKSLFHKITWIVGSIIGVNKVFFFF